MREIELHGEVAARIGRPALVDDEDYDRVMEFRWHVQRRGSHPSRGKRPSHSYVARGFRDPDGKHVMQTLGQFLTGFDKCEYIDHDGLNCQRSNLRRFSRCSSRPDLETSSQYKGVHWWARDGKWKVMLKADGEVHFGGMHASERTAATMYDLMALEHFGPAAYFNFPEYIEQVKAGSLTDDH